jgi:glycosyltransferase involved in cell wall biosynthesis
MRIAHLTAGTARFYCGTCLRDHALVAELRKLGHEALMVPLYLPLMAEKPAAEEAPIFLGGINAFLQQKSALFRNTPRWFDRVLDAPWLLDQLSAWSGMTSAQDLGEMTVAALKGPAGEQAKEFHRAADWLASEFRPDVVCLSNALLLGFAPAIRAATNAPVVCSLQGEESFLDQLVEPWRARAWELVAQRAAEADALVAVSEWYRDRMAGRLGLAPERVRVVHNGIPLEGFERIVRRPERPTVGYLAAMVPAKGLATLVDAYIALRGRGTVPGVRLHVAGSQPPGSAPFVRALMAKLDHAGALGDCTFAVDLTREQKLAFLAGLSVLSVPATYGEAFGLYVLEALAAGVPVVQPDSGAFPELLAMTQGGVLCRPHDPEALATGIEGILTEPEIADGMAQRGRDAVFARFGAKNMADAFARVLADVSARS